MDAPTAPERLRVELELDRDLVAKARSQGRDLSRLVERLLHEHMARRDRLDALRAAQAGAHVHASSAVVAKHGLWGEEFSTL